ncbi:MAG: TolC family protein [Crocinitomicaceae bacterium]|nr:TolC family protein [Crocinitomicaceae bacterium]
MNKSLIMSAFVMLAANGWTQSAFTLADAKIYALDNNLSVKNAENDNEYAYQRYIEIRGMGLPQVDFQGSFSNFINLPVQVVDASFINPSAPEGSTIEFVAGTKYSSAGTLQASQLLFNGSYIIGLKAANYLTKFQETASNITKEDVLFNVIQAYQLTSVAKENIAFVDSMVLITEQLIDKQENYLELGLMKQEDFDQLKYSLLTAKNSQLAAELQYKNALSVLKYAMGYPIEQNLEITENPDQLIAQPSLSNGSIQSNLTYSLLEKQVTLSELNIQNNRFQNLPTLSAFFQQTYNAFRNEFNFFANEKWYPQTLWGLQLNVPIFSGLTRKAVTAQSRITLMNDQNKLEQMEQTLKFQVDQAQNNLEGARSQNEMQKANVALARSLYENAITKEEVGNGNSIIVTQQYNQLIMAQAQYTGTLIELFQAQLSLDKIYNNILPNE